MKKKDIFVTSYSQAWVAWTNGRVTSMRYQLFKPPDFWWNDLCETYFYSNNVKHTEGGYLENVLAGLLWRFPVVL